MSVKPPWTFDSCGQLITTLGHGWVGWLQRPNDPDNWISHCLRVAHRLSASPRFAVFVLVLLLAACDPRCDVSESGPPVQRARALTTEQLAQIYADSVQLMQSGRHFRLARDDPAAQPFAQLKMLYAMGSKDSVTFKLGGCVDAAVFLTVDRGEGIRLSWGEQCTNCRASMWKLSEQRQAQ